MYFFVKLISGLPQVTINIVEKAQDAVLVQCVLVSLQGFIGCVCCHVFPALTAARST